MMLQPHELELIRRDHLDLLNGPDSVNLTIRWKTPVGTVDPVYGGTPSSTSNELTTRAHVTPFREVVNSSVRGSVFKDQERKSFGEVLAGDVMFLLKADIDLSGKEDLLFEVAGMGQWKPEFSPPAAANRYMVMFPNHQQVVQWIYCRSVKG